MPFCPSCGSNVEGRFCQKCGAAVGPAPASAFGAAPPAGSAPMGQAPVAAAAGLSENAAGALSYLAGVITGIIFLVVTPYSTNPRVRFHAFQSIFFNVAWVVMWIVVTILSVVIGAVLPFGFHILFSMFFLVVWLGGLLVWLLLMWKASQGQRLVLPLIGPLAEKQAGS
jgi:uncharacterized membrane protein